LFASGCLSFAFFFKAFITFSFTYATNATLGKKNRFGRAGRQYDVSGSISTIISLTAQTNALPVVCEFTNPGRFRQELKSG